MYTNELKYFVISDTTQKYEEINKKIITISKIYFYITQKYSYQLNQIEYKINNNNDNDINIKQLLDNQHNIIKELVKIINNILIEKINNEVIHKLEGQQFDISNEPIKQKNKSRNISQPIYIQNNISEKVYMQNKKSNKNIKNNGVKKGIKNNFNKSVDENLIAKKLLNQKKIIPLNIITPKTGIEFNGALSFLKNNKNNKVNNYKPYKQISKEKIEKSPINLVSKSSNKQEILNQNSLKNNNNNISFFMNNNYTIDEEKNDNYSRNNDRQYIVMTNNNLDEELPEVLNRRKQKIKYRNGYIYSSDRDIFRNKSLNYIPSKSEHYLNTNSSFLNFTLSNSTERYTDFSSKKRSNTSLNFFKSNLINILSKDNKYVIKSNKSKVYSIPYINNGKIITPTKYTKDIYNNSYKKLNHYQKKLIKNKFK